ncbi:MAG: alpha-amylase family glycosyl hydrolase [Candidatus Marinimicrobia bacterium]|nr:alpha-amylase family glycosyl hydrolase [Candidatus Neomarinimicrobiota bacterium]
MRPIRLIAVAFLIVLTAGFSNAQVVTSRPAYPMVTDSIVVIFNAKLGNQGLMGYTGTDVYAHTGVITDKSTSGSDWKYVKATWSTNLPVCKLTKVGEDLWELNIGKVRSYYGVPETEKILKLAFVFRNANGSKQGKEVGDKDIFHKLYEGGLTVVISEPVVDLSYEHPLRSPIFAEPEDTIRIVANAAALNTEVTSLELFLNRQSQYSTTDSVLNYDLVLENAITGRNLVEIIGKDTANVCDTSSFYIVVNPCPRNLPPPISTIPGINYIDDNTTVLALFAPNKQFVYLIGDFNDWKVDTSFLMNRYESSADSVLFWIKLESLVAATEYAFQYLVDGTLRIADPYTEKVLDPWNDSYILTTTYPDLKPYPKNKTSEPVATFQTGKSAFNWQTTSYDKPAKHELIIYELLLRDFLANHDYNTLTDTLDYLQNLGINAIELMPINEFEGNLSWGYNPSFYFALDKYYGSADALKKFIDECHRRGIAVIQDIVLNHSYGQSPLVRLYWNSALSRPSAENPWYNQTSPNSSYSWGYDFNHESPNTKAFVDRVLHYWVTEFHIDGFRFDFTKGFTNKTGDGSAYDDSRISILKRMSDEIWKTDSTVYIILEHFADNSEEKVLTNYGMLVWGNSNWNYAQSAMGYANESDFSWGFYKTRGFSIPGVVTYMESHDEERLMFKNKTYGNSSGSYSVKNEETALNRIKLDMAFFLTLPGPKMIWQFEELGYDFSIELNGRTGEKPIHWDYFDDENRLKLYKTIQALLNLRRENELFKSPETSVELNVSGATKRIRMSHTTMSAVILGNFDVVSRSIDPGFYQPGKWYDYFTGDSLELTNLNDPITLGPGELKLYTTKKMTEPEEGILSTIPATASMPSQFTLLGNYPNPFNASTKIRYEVEKPSNLRIEIYSIDGRQVFSKKLGVQQPGRYEFLWDGNDISGKNVASGVFLTVLKRSDQRLTGKILLIK